MNIIRILCRYIVGLVFIYSGFVKGIDPLGSTYKFIEYFSAVNLNFLDSFAFFFSILLSASEFIIGMSLVLGLRMKVASWAVLLFMSFFTILTFLSALFNPVSDCGCFGDAIKLTNWQTFYKNIGLLVLVLIIFLNRNKYKAKYKIGGEWLSLGVILIGFLLVVRYSYHHLPIIDFLPYKTGTHIKSAMEIPEGAPRDEYKTVLYYQKDGVVQEFTMENYPWQDTTWKWVDSKTIKIKDGYKPPIHDFSISDLSGADITDLVLSDHGYSFILVAYNLDKVNSKGLQKASKLADYCSKNNCNFYALTSSPETTIKEVLSDTSIRMPFYHADETTLKTMIRSNPGLLLLKEGVILGKWSALDIPDASLVQKNLLSYTLQYYAGERESLMRTLLLLSLLIVLAVIKIVQLNFDRRA